MGRAGTTSHLAVLRMQLLQTTWRARRLLVCSVGRRSPCSGRAGQLSQACFLTHCFIAECKHLRVVSQTARPQRCSAGLAMETRSPCSNHHAANQDHP